MSPGFDKQVIDSSEVDDKEDEPRPTEPTQITTETEEPEIDLSRLPETNAANENNMLPGIKQNDIYEDEDDENDDDDAYSYQGFDLSSMKKQPEQKQPSDLVVTRLEPIDAEEQNSHFFFHLVILAFLVAIVYITYHNKRKIFLLVQSRRWRDSLCSRNTVEYHRLDTNVNEAMPSLKITRDYIF
ncbi:hypothetical protein WMY93_007510 [Mugilogobius chulae]|uniref:Keratinocyte-associated transmembrane protein 2 n=1 Tax=Mugilogobius chulae TaxID=88201 RepID=A0AAW0PM07_9GOBI